MGGGAAPVQQTAARQQDRTDAHATEHGARSVLLANPLEQPGRRLVFGELAD
jgi:hypothetical protein